MKGDPVYKDVVMTGTNQRSPEQIGTYDFPNFNPNKNNSYNYPLLTKTAV